MSTRTPRPPSTDMVIVPLPSGVELHARISTPGNPIASAIDYALPSIVFCHPTWLDSFFL
jgi:hypothetical protein